MTIRYKICSFKSPLDLEIDRYNKNVEKNHAILDDLTTSFEARSDEYLCYDQSLLTEYQAIFKETLDSLPPENLKNQGIEHLHKKLIRVNDILCNLYTLLSYLNEHQTEINALDTLQLAPEKRTMLQTLLSVFWSSNQRHDYFKLRNKYLIKFTNHLHNILSKSIADELNSESSFYLYQKASCDLKTSSHQFLWLKVSLSFRKIFEVLKFAKNRDIHDIEFDNPGGKNFASITVRAGKLKPEDLKITYPEEEVFTAEQLFKKLQKKDTNIIASDGTILIDPFNEEEVQAKLNPFCSEFGFNVDELVVILQGCFEVNIYLEQQQNLAMAFSPLGREMTQEHIHHSFSFFQNRFDNYLDATADVSFTPTTVTESNIRDHMNTINEINANALMVRFGKTLPKAFVNDSTVHFLSQFSGSPNLRRYSLERERSQLINSELSTRIHSRLEQEGFLNENGLLNSPNDLFSFFNRFGFNSSEKTRLNAVLKDINIIDSDQTLSRAQRRQVIRILKKASETKFSPDATIRIATIATNEHCLISFTVFLIEDGDKNWILYPYDHLGNPSYNLRSLPKNNPDFQKALSNLPHQINMPKGTYYTFFNGEMQVITKHTSLNDLALLYRKITSNQWLLRSLGLLTILGFLFPQKELLNFIHERPELAAGFVIYALWKIPRFIAAIILERMMLKTSEFRRATLKYGLSIITGALFVLMAIVQKHAFIRVGETDIDLFMPLLVANIFFSSIRWPINHKKILEGYPVFPKIILAAYVAAIATVLTSIYLPDFVLTNDITPTLLLVLTALRLGTFLRRDLAKGETALEERYPHKISLPTVVASLGFHAGATATLIYSLDKLLDYIYKSYYMLP